MSGAALRAAVRRALPLTGAAYARVRDEALAAPDARAVAALDKLVASPSPDEALVASAWRGWIQDRQTFENVLVSFSVEEANAREKAPVRYEPRRQLIADAIVRYGGPAAAPVLAEILWKTPRAPAWRREAALLALEGLGEHAAFTIRRLAEVVEARPVRDRLQTLVRVWQLEPEDPDP